MVLTVAGAEIRLCKKKQKTRRSKAAPSLDDLTPNCLNMLQGLLINSPLSQRVGASSVLSMGDGELRRMSGKLLNSY